MRRRDELGRFTIGDDDSYLLNLEELDSYKDQKCYDVKFPIHNQTKPSEVTVTYTKVE